VNGLSDSAWEGAAAVDVGFSNAAGAER